MAGIQTIDEAKPDETYDCLVREEGAVLVDVRTKEEWQQVGVPDLTSAGRPLWKIEWVSGPHRQPNTQFLREILERAEGALPERMFFICRSGVRSAAAADAVAAFAASRGEKVQCTNVLEGFEGADAASGWRDRGLPSTLPGDGA